MPKKKKNLFTRSNSVRYRVLPGNSATCNADGEILKTIFVPVSHYHKKGSSLLFSNLEATVSLPVHQNPFSEITTAPSTAYPDLNDKILDPLNKKEPDLQKILQDFEDAETVGDEEDGWDDCDDEEEDYDGDKDDCDNEDLDSDDDHIVSPVNTFPKKQFHTINIQSSNKDFESESVNPIVQYLKDIDDNGCYSDVSDQFSDAEEFNHKRTEYALTSAKEDCPELIKIFNDQFEKLLDIYDDDQIGALDDEEIGGLLTTDQALAYKLIDVNTQKEECLEFGNCDSYIKEQTLYYAEQDEKIVKIVCEPPKAEYDCESFLSTYSNIYNHPTIIKGDPKIKKIKIPDNPLKTKLVKSHLKQLDKEECDDDNSEESEDNQSVITRYNVRHKDETPEERRERKKLFKEAKRESRMLKKENRIAFKKEKLLQNAQLINTNKNRGIKLL